MLREDSERVSELMELRRRTPETEQSDDFDPSEFLRLLVLIRNSDETMVEGAGYVAGEMAVASACPHLIRAIRQFPDKAIDMLDESCISSIMQLLKSEVAAEQGCSLLGWVTYHTKKFSEFILSSELLSFLAENMVSFPESLVRMYYTLIANLLTDTHDGSRLESSGFLHMAASIPQRLWNDEYIRMVTAMVRSKGVSLLQIENMLGVYIDVLLADEADISLKKRCLIDLLALIKNPKLEEKVCAQCIRLVPSMEKFFTSCNGDILVRILRLCDECLSRSEAFCSCVIMKQSPFLEWMLEVLDINNIEIRRVCLGAIGRYIEKTPGFGEDEALKLAQCDWKSMFFDGSFDIKVAIVRTFRALIKYLPPAVVISVLDEPLLRDFCELAGADDSSAKFESCFFLCQICISPVVQDEDFRSMFLNVVEDMVTEVLKQDELMSLTKEIREIAHQTLITIKDLSHD